MSGPEPLTLAYERDAALIRDALASDRELQPDWRATLGDVLSELERIAQNSQHPDPQMWARIAVGVLAGLWLTEDEQGARHVDLFRR